jgi:hypothetical protein
LFGTTFIKSCKSSVESVDGICVEIDRDGVA